MKTNQHKCEYQSKTQDLYREKADHLEISENSPSSLLSSKKTVKRCE
jgi:hypothetical protein